MNWTLNPHDKRYAHCLQSADWVRTRQVQTAHIIKTHTQRLNKPPYQSWCGQHTHSAWSTSNCLIWNRMNPVVKTMLARHHRGLDCLSPAIKAARQMEEPLTVSRPQSLQSHSALLWHTIHWTAATYPTPIIKVLHTCDTCHSALIGTAQCRALNA